MDLLDEELLGIWRQFQLHGVRYLVVGGFATSFHGYPRFTADCDIWLQDTTENRKKFSLALSHLGFGEHEKIEKMEFLPGWTTFRLFSGMELDVMTSLVHYSQLDFEECYLMSVRAEIMDVEVSFLHINHLIAEKRASGRGKDILDAEELEKIHARLNEKK